MKKIIAIISFTLLLFACKNEDDYYKRPEWLKGSIYEILQQDSDYSLYCEAVEMIGLKNQLDGQMLLTAFVPNNTAIKKWLSDNQFSSLKDVPLDRLDEAIRYTLIIKGYNKERLETFHYDLYEFEKGLFTTFNTICQPAPKLHKVKIENEVKSCMVMANKKNLLVYSDAFFNAMKSDNAELNINSIYGDGFYNGNAVLSTGARITDYEIPADNGYLYKIDKFADAAPTIDQVLEKDERFSRFRDIYHYYFIRWETEEAPENYQSDWTGEWAKSDAINGGVDIVHSFATGETTVGKNQAFVLGVTNEALENFITTRWGAEGLEDYSKIPQIGIQYILKQHMFATSGFFGDLQTGLVQSEWGDEYQFTTDDIVSARITENGIFYGLKEVQIPSFMKGVMGEAVLNLDYNTFAYFLDLARASKMLNNQDINFGLLIADNKAMEDIGYVVESNKLMKINKENGARSEVGKKEAESVFAHYVFMKDDVIDLSGSGYLKNVESFHVVKYQDGKLYVNENDYQSSDQTYATILEVNEEPTNGITYKIQGSIKGAEDRLGGVLQNVEEYGMFNMLLKEAKLYSFSRLKESLVNKNRLMVLVPSNKAIQNGIDDGTIPPLPLSTDTEDVQEEKQKALSMYCMKYFVPMEENRRINYILPGYEEALNVVTRQVSHYDLGQEVFVELKINATQDQLEIQNLSNEKSAKTIHKEDGRITADGMIFSIDALL
ncbi:MAG: fasciclin domain-containing protein [Carboxylicivirga sp.]|nr:fasciclin domain-containing protein [Carboxylicivirga sp.]